MGDLSIRARVSILLFGTVVAAAASSMVIFASLDRAREDVDIINALGRQRMLSHAMTRSMLGYAMTESSLNTPEQEILESGLGLDKLNPGLDEYTTTRRIFVETLTAMRSGGELSTDLRMTRYRAIDKLEDPAMVAKIAEIEQELALYVASVEQLKKSVAAGEAYWPVLADIQGGTNRLGMLSDDLVTLYTRHANQNQANIGRSVVAMLVAVAVAFLLIGVMIKSIISSLMLFSGMLDSIARGKGDLTKRINVTASDEIGLVGHLFNTFIAGLQILIKDIVEAFRVISSVAVDIRGCSQAMGRSTQKLFAAADESASSVAQMSSAISSVAAEAEALLQRTQLIASSIHEMHHSISEVADSTDDVSLSAEQTASFISKISSSLKAVSSHVDSLFHETGDAVSSSEQVSRVVETVTERAREQAAIARKVKDDASALGLDAVEKTIDGMRKIKQESMAMATIIGELEERSSKITQVTQVIGEITETTNLLSLNAAIIAAKAGEHGKSFAVVAEEVKRLARRTTESTGEIAELIGLVQDGVTVAKQSMETSASGIEEGVNLSINAREALHTIVESSESSLEVAHIVENAAEEQATGLRRVMHSIQKMNDMVQAIKQATGEQGLVSDEILIAANGTSEATLQVKSSAQEQRETSERIASMVAEMASKMATITDSTAEQELASERILFSVETMKNEVLENVHLVDRLWERVTELDDKRGSLQDKVDSFNV
ncbi:MAG: HAMP domain-containing protein [bacterium]|nr:HAMP domain-containing protein [bacterium]